jgi:ABC-type Na+ transport system ATPase subunit NatA
MDEVESGDMVFIMDHGEIIVAGELDLLLLNHGVDNITELFNSLITKPE